MTAPSLFGLPDRKARAEAVKRFARTERAKGSIKPKSIAAIAHDVRRERSTGPLDGAPAGARYVVHEGDLTDVGATIPEASVDCVYADILYKNVAMAQAVATLAGRVLVPGGVLALVDGNGDSLPIIEAFAAAAVPVLLSPSQLP